MYVTCIFTQGRGGIQVSHDDSGQHVSLVVIYSRWQCGAEGDHPYSSAGALATTENYFATIHDCASNLGEDDIAACIA